MSDNISMMTDDGALPDWIEVRNAAREPLRLRGYSLILGAKINETFSFPDVTLVRGGCALIYAQGMEAGALHGDWSAPFRLPASGGVEMALLSPGDRMIDSVTLPELSPDETYARDASGAWEMREGGTPSADNSSIGAPSLGMRATWTRASTSKTTWYIWPSRSSRATPTCSTFAATATARRTASGAGRCSTSIGAFHRHQLHPGPAPSRRDRLRQRDGQLLFIALMKNPIFYDHFLNCMGEQMATTISTQNVLPKFLERQELLKPIFAQYEARWGHETSSRACGNTRTRPKKIIGYFRKTLKLPDADLEKYFGAEIRKANEGEDGNN